jgi:hypothetical protein
MPVPPQVTSALTVPNIRAGEETYHVNVEISF